MPEAGTLIYLHGFRSSSQSIKSQQVVQAMAATHWQVEVPDLPLAPKLAMAKIEDLLVGIKTPVAIVGSSLGGYYATYLACRYAVPVSIVNPAVQAYELVKQYIGPVENMYTGETEVLTSDHIQQLLDMEVDLQNYAATIQVFLKTTDEVLDSQLALQIYRNFECWIDAGGDHSFSDFDKIIPAIFRFLGIKTRTTA